MNDLEKNRITYYTNCIRKGINDFVDVGDRKWKEIIKDKLMVEIENGTATDHTIKAVKLYFKDQIKRDRITLEDVPDSMRNAVKEELENEKA